MTKLLAGVHDRESAAIVPAGGWIVDTVALGRSEGPTDYSRLAPGVNWIVRINNNYHPNGTIPTSDRYEAFAAQCANYVQHSNACTRWIIGNEPNLTSVEAPNGQPISAADYARCFSLCRQAIKRVQPNAEVIPAPVAPYNVESGDWLQYWRGVLDRLGPGGCDGLGIHAYIRSNNPADVTSDAKMDAPFAHRYSQFRTYRDSLGAVPANMRHLPVYLTEFNPLIGWQATGVIPAMLGEIDAWNKRPGVQLILCAVAYRYPLYDKWGFADKPAVIAEFHAAAPQYRSPQPQPAPSQPSPPPGPTVPTPPTPPLARQWDKRLDARGVRIETPAAMPGDRVWRVVEGVWLDERQAQGRHHLFVDVLDTDGKRLAGIPLRVTWPSGSARIVTEAKPGELWAANYPMSPSRNEFSIRVDEGGFASETVSGIGMGAETPGGFNAGIHTSTGLVFQRVPVPAIQPIPPLPMPPTPETETNPVQPATAYVNAIAGLNLRKGPGTEHGVWETLAHGTPVEIIGRQGDWLQTRMGWLHSAYVSTTRPPVDPHIAPPPVQPVTPPSGIIDPLAGQAIIAIESGGQAFGPGGRLLIRFETHLFNRHTNNAHANLFRHGDPPWTGQEWRKSGNDPWRQVHMGSQETEWAAFEHAATFNRNAALLSISMGLGQILGSHYRRLGYASAESMFRSFGDQRYGTAAQMLGFLNFFLSDARLFQAMRNKDFLTVATLYNGPGQAQNYANLMAAEYRRLGGAS